MDYGETLGSIIGYTAQYLTQDGKYYGKRTVCSVVIIAVPESSSIKQEKDETFIKRIRGEITVQDLSSMSCALGTTQNQGRHSSISSFSETFLTHFRKPTSSLRKQVNNKELQIKNYKRSSVFDKLSMFKT
ncbi:hypothetical protein P5673_016773 [Acropora cervicornis]|uniref:Uncharacterized protein n=1 Tax=Acropora cervicornis TaxID=6130 RepID=A0AAD9QFN2_ACRCE|nr:hypothetical protein P5673_016773 [Acropora cervicornis]